MSETDQSREYEGPYEEYYYEGMEEDLLVYSSNNLHDIVPIDEFLLSNAILTPVLRTNRIQRLKKLLDDNLEAKWRDLNDEELETELLWQFEGEYRKSLEEITKMDLSGTQYEFFAPLLSLASGLPALERLIIKYKGFFLPPYLSDYSKLASISFDLCPNLFLNGDPLKSLDPTKIKSLIFTKCNLN